MTREGPDFKTWLVTKEGCEAAGFSTFAGTGVNVTQDGRPYLGAAVGSTEYIEKFVKSKVNSWLSSVCNLTAIARTQPHAAYSALTHGLSSKWTYLCRTVPNISNLLKPLDDILQTKLIPALTGKSPPSDLECALFALPARMSWLGIAIPSQQADREHLSSLMHSKTTLYCRTRPMDTRSLPSNWNLRLSLETKTGRKAQKLHVNSL